MSLREDSHEKAAFRNCSHGNTSFFLYPAFLFLPSSPIKDREFGFLHFPIVTFLYPLLTPMPTPSVLDIFPL